MYVVSVMGHKPCVIWVHGKLQCIVFMGCVQCTQSAVYVGAKESYVLWVDGKL